MERVPRGLVDLALYLVLVYAALLIDMEWVRVGVVAVDGLIIGAWNYHLGIKDRP